MSKREVRMQEEDILLDDDELEEAGDPSASFGDPSKSAGPATGQTPKRRADKRNPEGKKHPQGSTKNSTPGQGTMKEDDDRDDDDADDSDDSDEKNDKKDKKDKKKGKKFNFESRKISSSDLYIDEDLDAILEGAEFEDDFKDRAATIFKAAVVSATNSSLLALDEEINEELDAAKDDISTELVDQVDAYLNHIVENFMHENEIAIESGIRNELTEDFLKGLHQLFAEHYVDVPEDKVNVVEELGERVEELENELDSTLNKALDMQEELEGLKRNAIFEEVVSELYDLSESQVEKLRSLSEGVEFDGADSYRENLGVLYENYYPSDYDTTSGGVDTGEVLTEEGEKVTYADPNMAKYVNALSQDK
tara:strand:+ start:2264 stop:3358 length:1095 start_codon:yes stop_codon:yes gene_type:complete